MKATRVCSVPECDRPAKARGWCINHYHRWRRHGDPLGDAGRGRGTLLDRLARRLVPNGDGCLEWTGTLNSRGYGLIRAGGDDLRMLFTHRVAWESANGPIPDGLFVCHHCDNRVCCNVDHLFLGTAADNSRDMVLKGRSARGVRSPNARWTEAEVVAIRALAEAGWTQREIAQAFDVREPSVSALVTRARWGHV